MRDHGYNKDRQQGVYTNPYEFYFYLLFYYLVFHRMGLFSSEPGMIHPKTTKDDLAKAILKVDKDFSPIDNILSIRV